MNEYMPWVILVALLGWIGVPLARRALLRWRARRAQEVTRGLTQPSAAATPAEEKAAEVDEVAAQAQEEAERLQVERARLETERQQAAQAALAAEHAAQLEAERRRAEQARLEAERQQAEQAALAAERAAQLEAERRRAEQVRLEAERQQAEQARLEAERIEAQRLEAERLQALQAEQARLEAERAEAARLKALQEEQARQAAEKARREEADRRAAELACEQARLAAEEAARLQAQAEALASTPAVAARPRLPAETLVLVADDSKVVRVKTSRLLAKHGYRVSLAEDGSEAMRQLEEAPPHVLITDVEMPGMDGFELSRHVRGLPHMAHIPIIMVTAAEDKHAPQAAESGVSVLLGKPYRDEELIAHVESSLTGAELAAR